MSTEAYNAGLVWRVRSFANTMERAEGVDRLASSESLVAWLEEMELLDDEDAGRTTATATATRHDLALARELRTTIRGLLRRDDGSPGGFGPDSPARRQIERLSAELPLRVELCSDGQPFLVPAVRGVRYGLARVLAATAALSPDDWDRLKVCPADDCQWVFYDSSRNRSRRWCSMESCGNRQKVRSYRDRH